MLLRIGRSSSKIWAPIGSNRIIHTRAGQPLLQLRPPQVRRMSSLSTTAALTLPPSSSGEVPHHRAPQQHKQQAKVRQRRSLSTPPPSTPCLLARASRPATTSLWRLVQSHKKSRCSSLHTKCNSTSYRASSSCRPPPQVCRRIWRISFNEAVAHQAGQRRPQLPLLRLW